MTDEQGRSRDSLTRAVDALRHAHAEALGAVETELKRITCEHEVRIAAAAERAAKVHTGADGSAAQNRVWHAAEILNGHRRSLIDRGDIEPLLRAAQFVELGALRVKDTIATSCPVPLIVPFLGSGSITVVGAAASVDPLIRKVHLETVLGTAPGQLTLIAYDPNLRNPLAAFAPLTEGGANLVRTLHLPRQLDGLIEELGQSVIRVGNALLGGLLGLVEYRQSIGQAIEGFTVVSFHDYPAGVTEQQHTSLIKLAQVAPRHGIAFVFHIPDTSALPPWLDLAEILALSESFSTPSAGAVVWDRNPDFDNAITGVAAADVTAAIHALISDAETAATVTFDKLLPEQQWTQESTDGITVAIAQAGLEPAEITFSDDLVHGLITGSTGTGKSNLINVLIYGLGARYSPEELEFYLLDFKEGITLAPLAPTSDSPEFLPHARVLGMDADQDFGLSVLLEIERVYKRRLAHMKPHDSIKSYRRAHPDNHMPRIVVIIDEFQGLLAQDTDHIGRQAADKLLFLVRSVRAAGIHIILATQDIGSVAGLINARDGIMSQLGLRIGLKNTPQESARTFTLGNEAAAALRAKGEVVINRNLGSLQANQIATVPLADTQTLSALRRRWFEQRPPQTAPPAVFYGNATARITDDIDAVRKAQQALSTAHTGRLLLGHPLTVNQSPVEMTLDPIPGRNLAIVGNSNDSPDDNYDDDNEAPTHSALGIATACGLALAAQHAPGSAEFIIFDLLAGRERHDGRITEWCDALRALGHRPQTIGAAAITTWITETSAQLTARGPESPPTYVFGLGFDRVSPTITEREGGLGSVAPLKHLHRLWQNGPAHRVHSIFWWASGPMLLTHTERSPDNYFSGAVVLPGAGDAGKSLLHATVAWDGADNRAMFRDALMSQGRQKIIPYRPLSAEALAAFVEAVRP